MEARGIVLLAGLLSALAARADALEVLSARALDRGERTSVMLLIRNPEPEAVTLSVVRLAGRPLAERMAWEDKRPRLGADLDWCDVRPATIPSGQAGVLVLGYAGQSLLQPELVLEVADGRRTHKLIVPTPRPESLKVASATFDPSMRDLTVILRNDGIEPVELQTLLVDGRAVQPRILGGRIPPGMIAVCSARLAEPAVAGADMNLLVRGRSTSHDDVKVTAWFRAYPAEALSYIFYGQHVDRRELLAKNIDIPATRREGNAEVGREVDSNRGKISSALAQQLSKRVALMKADPTAWGWYMQDDAAFGTPRPQSILDVGRLLRAEGSEHRQVLCNPADSRRYAWVSDAYLNYFYHATYQGRDPAVFRGDRSPDRMRWLNEPAPLAYVVDSVGQSVRWITPAEEEIASYAILGNGARYPGWFMGPSMWDQGGRFYGGIDSLETLPWRYQEGAVACKQVWDHMGRIAGFWKSLQPYLGASAPFAGGLTAERIDVLPIYCAGDVIVTPIINRRVNCTYPADYEKGSRSGGIRLVPHRHLTIAHRVPDWIRPAEVLAFDHDRGLRAPPFRVAQGQLEVRLDALDAVTTLIALPTATLAADIRRQSAERFQGAVGGSVLAATDAVIPRASAAPWHITGCHYRCRVALPDAAGADEWIEAELPLDSRDPRAPLGGFDPASVVLVDAAGKRLPPARVDYLRSVYDPRQGLAIWGLGGGEAAGPARDDFAEVRADGQGLHVTAAYSRNKPGRYGNLRLLARLDPRYEILEIEHEGEGQILPLIAYDTVADGKPAHVVTNLQVAWQGALRGQSQWTEMPRGRLPVVRIQWLDVVRQAEKDRAAKSGKPQASTPREVGAATLRFQLYDTDYRIGAIRQLRARPRVAFRRPGVAAGSEVYVYFDFGGDRGNSLPGDTAGWPRTGLATAGPLEAFELEACRYRMTDSRLEELKLTSQAELSCAWVEARDAAGRFLQETPLKANDGLSWELAGSWPLPQTVASVIAIGADRTGRVLAATLKSPPQPARLQEFSRVSGQVEDLACSSDGRWVLSGAEKVVSLDAQGNQQWTFDLGENRRQPGHFGPGRNVEQVAIRDDGQVALARSFRWNAKTRAYEDSRIVAIASSGRKTVELPCHRREPARFNVAGQIEFVEERGGKLTPVVADPFTGSVQPRPARATKDGYWFVPRSKPGQPPTEVLVKNGKECHEVTWPPYTLHRQVAGDGRVVASTTQGLVQLWRPDGSVAWKIERPSRIDGLLLLAARGVLAVAYKEYPHRWEWQARAVLELIDLEDGRSRTLRAGELFDDFGHYGTHLVLAGSREGNLLYLGDPSGRIYRFPLAP